jgi:hypothetical protein
MAYGYTFRVGTSIFEYSDVLQQSYDTKKSC